MDKLQELWDYLIDSGLATDEEIDLVVNINGYNLETLESILYVRSGYRSLDQIDKENGYNE
jgi:hypothetical protein